MKFKSPKLKTKLLVFFIFILRIYRKINPPYNLSFDFTGETKKHLAKTKTTKLEKNVCNSQYTKHAMNNVFCWIRVEINVLIWLCFFSLSYSSLSSVLRFSCFFCTKCIVVVAIFFVNNFARLFLIICTFFYILNRNKVWRIDDCFWQFLVMSHSQFS